jgi:putative radical SAM enzyme (TIGR03279 family)
MSSTLKALVETVLPGSIAAEIGIKPGDEIVSINGEILTDLIDYQYAMADETITIRVRRSNGEEWEAEIEKDYDDDLGIGFASAVFDTIRRCHNACVFCFVDQMPPGMRSTLYVKDDDYRLSFLYGNFITLTNLCEEDFVRIERLHLSPLYVSVHTTDPLLRKKMLSQPKAEQIMPQLQRLIAAGIDVHTQIVLCPALNDGENLTKTLNDLGSLGQGVLSVAIVPVGLTQFREKLFPLRGFTSAEASKVINQVKPWQKKFSEEYGEPLIYLSDEFYLAAGLEIPQSEEYGDFPQIENGVGLTRLFIEDWYRAWEQIPQKVFQKRKVTLVGGISGARVMEPLLAKLKIDNINIQFITIANSFFGQGVTVTGLLTGRDIIETLKYKDLGDAVIIPGITLKHGEEVFLDDMTVAEVAKEILVSVEVAHNPEELVKKILGT